MNKMLFKSDLTFVSDLSILSGSDVRTLPQLFRCDADFVQILKCSQLNAILEVLPDHPEYKYLSIDSRTHMLFKDFYPNIPGWHCDDFYRTPENQMQPDLENLLQDAPSIHYMALIGNPSRTEFINEDVYLPTSREILALNTGKPIYYDYDVLLDEMIEQRKLTTTTLEPEKLYRFGPLCFHSGQGATTNGWRYFIRFTFSNHYEAKNELRYQTQVYTRERVSW